MKNRKSLGQNWLKDRAVLDEIVRFAGVSDEDVVLEIGPGLGTLTSALLRRAKTVVAVELDESLATNLPAQFPGKNLQVISADILQFDFGCLPANYKVVANLPYYITSKIIRALLEAAQKPQSITILVQKEVAERIAQVDGSSILGLAVENWAEVKLGQIVPAELFTPPPKVNSQIVRLDLRPQPLVEDEKTFMRVVRAAFSEKRKKLRSSLSGGLAISKDQAELLLRQADLDPNSRAQELVLSDFVKLAKLI